MNSIKNMGNLKIDKYANPHSNYKNYDLFLMAFCVALLISNICAVKLLQIGPFHWGNLTIFPKLVADGGAFLFPFTYIIGDILAEVYGLKLTSRAIKAGMACGVLASIIFLIVQFTPALDSWQGQAAWEQILGFAPRIIIASIVGDFLGQFANAYALIVIRNITGLKFLWTRLIGSTICGELVDTVTFCLIAFGGIISGSEMLNYIMVGYIYKCCVEIFFLPITYRVIKLVKKSEGF